MFEFQHEKNFHGDNKYRQEWKEWNKLEISDEFKTMSLIQALMNNYAKNHDGARQK